MGSRNWPGKLDLMNVILIGVAEELPGKGPEYELHRLLGTLFSSELTENEKDYRDRIPYPDGGQYQKGCDWYVIFSRSCSER